MDSAIFSQTIQSLPCYLLQTEHGLLWGEEDLSILEYCDEMTGEVDRMQFF